MEEGIAAAGGGGSRIIYTLGTSNRELEEFLELLRSRGISRVCDVRSFPTSRRYPHFSSPRFAETLRERGLEYLWLGEELGGYRQGGYREHMRSELFRRGMDELEGFASGAPTAVVCAEKFPWKCHRRFIAAALEERGWKVIHVIDAEREWIPSPGGKEDQPALDL